MAIGDNRLFTRAEVEAWQYDHLVNGNPAADLDSYWTPELVQRVTGAVLFKLPIKVDELRRTMGIVSPYSRSYPNDLWLHPDAAIGNSYLYQVLGDDP